MPVSAGSACRTGVNASSPPAEAPTPTIGNGARRLDASDASPEGGSAWDGEFLNGSRSASGS